MKKILIVIASIILMLASATEAGAIYKPTSVVNNRFGIHILDPNELTDAASLVNGGGGDWGYVTIVIQKGERDTERWTPVFEKFRELHIIPVVRVATKPILNIWEAPSVDEIDGWVSFLNSLPWPTKNRYVVVGNEPNHAAEWGGKVKPDEYANYLKVFSQKLKQESDKFYVLPAGFDAAASNTFFTTDEEYYLRRMLLSVPDIFEHIDGWTSHSYPNPAFIGSVYDTGRRSIRGYQWELNLLKSLGVEHDFDVFITETGWVHNVKNEAYNYLTPEKVGENFEFAFNNVWNDARVVTVTPFVLNYQSWPFDIFSWKDKEGNYYDFYFKVMNLPKERGNPILEPTPTPSPKPTRAPEPAPIPTIAPTPEPGLMQKVFGNIKGFLLQLVR